MDATFEVVRRGSRRVCSGRVDKCRAGAQAGCAARRASCESLDAGNVERESRQENHGWHRNGRLCEVEAWGKAFPGGPIASETCSLCLGLGSADSPLLPCERICTWACSGPLSRRHPQRLEFVGSLVEGLRGWHVAQDGASVQVPSEDLLLREGQPHDRSVLQQIDDQRSLLFGEFRLCQISDHGAQRGDVPLDRLSLVLQRRLFIGVLT